MPQQPKRPFSLLVCRVWIHLASRLVPAAQRSDWRKEWNAEIWHQWQFLAHAGAWDRHEAVRLFSRSAGALPDAFWHLTGQDAVQHRFRAWMRSPWTCLGILSTCLLALAVLTGFFPATRGILLDGVNRSHSGLAFIWFHPAAGGGDEGLPPDLVPAWQTHSRKLEAVAPFVIGHRVVRTSFGESAQPLVVKTQSRLWQVLDVQASLGHLASEDGVVLTAPLWKSLFHEDPNVIGRNIQIGREWHRVTAVLPKNFRFLSRQPAAYLMERILPDQQQMVVARLKQGVTETKLDKELVQIAETACYYNFRGELRYSFLTRAAWIPLEVFAIAALTAAVLVTAVSKGSLRRMRIAIRSADRRTLALRVGFFSAKVLLAFAVVFTAVAEWSRSPHAILFASRDPAAGPFMLWLYILGAMGVLFWAVADQRARCRVCLQLLAFPVRIGCPGCLLLNWSGTELLCSEGHGILHVPHMAPSWEDAEHWISLDDSWRELFAETKQS
jgi:hypothetical protein